MNLTDEEVQKIVDDIRPSLTEIALQYLECPDNGALQADLQRWYDVFCYVFGRETMDIPWSEPATRKELNAFYLR